MSEEIDDNNVNNIDDEPEFIKGVRHRRDIISKELYDHMIFCGSNEFNKLPKEAKELLKEHSKPMCAYFASLLKIIKKFDNIKRNKEKKEQKDKQKQ